MSHQDKVQDPLPTTPARLTERAASPAEDGSGYAQPRKPPASLTHEPHRELDELFWGTRRERKAPSKL